MMSKQKREHWSGRGNDAGGRNPWLEFKKRVYRGGGKKGLEGDVLG